MAAQPRNFGRLNVDVTQNNPAEGAADMADFLPIYDAANPLAPQIDMSPNDGDQSAPGMPGFAGGPEVRQSKVEGKGGDPFAGMGGM